MAVHQLKLAPWVIPAVATTLDENAPRQAPLKCEPMRKRWGSRLRVDAGGWRWCTFPPLGRADEALSSCGKPPPA